MKFPIILLTLSVLAVAVYPSEGQEGEERPCRVNGAAWSLFQRDCRVATEWDVEKDDGEERITCRCIGLFIKQCIRCVYFDPPITTDSSDTSSPSESSSEASTTQGGNSEEPSTGPPTETPGETTTSGGIETTTSGPIESTTNAAPTTA